MANTYTYRKYMGDDVYSYAVFERGRPIMTGLSRSSAKYECDRRNPPKPAVEARRISVHGIDTVYVMEEKQKGHWFPMTVGYAIGARGRWRVFDGDWSRKARSGTDKIASLYGNELGAAATIREAIALRLARREETGQQKWIRHTREAVARALRKSGMPETQNSLEHNLDVGDYLPTLGGMTGVRSAREIGAALRWLKEQGYARVLKPEERLPEDPKDMLYEITPKGAKFASLTKKGM